MEFPKLPPHSGSVLSVVDMHTGGEPLRIILSGFPEVKGDTILAKRRYVREHLDHLRKVLMFEPRGHYDMYGALLVKNVSVSVPGYKSITVDISYGGALYAFVSAEKFGLDVNKSKTRDLVDAATAVSDAVKSQVKLHHPVSEDLAFLYGTILTDGKDGYSEEPTTNVCVFADAQVDRSPTGSGVTARIALQYHKGLIALNQTRSFQSGATGSVFTGTAVEETMCGDFRAVVVEVRGHAHYSGVASFTQESDDPLSGGFLLR
ncbi:trans-L-3-hydroxyproline dehydratase isoform X2 [Siphateles boraxobius]|uniref:trans-L-3-hydroxyproline dehydratase isoform X2 n=1 Tax=Siphateles boraxobius TaxID=180520 RepID=UPI004064A103